MRSKWTKQQFIDAVTNNLSAAGVLRDLGLVPIGGNYKTFNKYIQKWNINIDHFTGQAWNQGARYRVVREKEPLETILVKGRFLNNSSLRKRLIQENIIENVCSICKIDTWLEQPITCHLDHINGDNSDNRIENLRLLCPNCHSQTETYCAFNVNKSLSRGKMLLALPKNKPPTKSNFCKCGIEIGKDSKTCSACKPTKINWPPRQELYELVWSYPTSTISKQLGISDVAISKRCKKLGIDKPPRGYWAKQSSFH